jgi:hypothetical protein
VETAVSKAYGRYAIVGMAAALLALIGILATTGRPPDSNDIQRFEANGIMTTQPSHIGRIEIRLGNDRIAFRRADTGSWAFDASHRPVPNELASHVDAGLRFMHVSTPARMLDPSDYRGTSFVDFGLDPPAYLVSLGITDGSSLIADFGALNPAGTSQYVRIVGHPTLYLLPRHVGAEWQLAADMAKRISPHEHGEDQDATTRELVLLLPVSVDRLGAMELVTGAKLHRFERDGSGNWFLHVGQHVHSSNTPAHVADPVQARIIGAALAAFDRAQIEAVVTRHPIGSELDRYGLSRPALIALTYARDSSTPLARIEFGGKADDNFSRYARISDEGDVVTIAAYEADRLIQMLKAVGAGS